MKEAGDSVGKEFSKKMEASFVLLDPFVSLFFAFREASSGAPNSRTVGQAIFRTRTSANRGRIL